MRLKSVKLAGFKSFVDSTTINFPSGLCCVVGPVGCGKSNIIDAVRWVMGESSARSLRGDAITDVIFKGTSARKSVGQASVELVFDNQDHGFSGEYANFDEVSVKRQIDSEAQSTYYLNGTRVRRKDVTDIFLGTGLGARSYSIIEQAMVSQLVESKPEELRAYIEEAAGISRYKERRKETENRIRRTRENLAGLEDIRLELERQLQYLQRQSVAAEKYQALQRQQRQTRARLHALQWQGLQDQIEAHQQRTDQLQIELEANTAELRAIDADIEQHRSDNAELTDARDQVQADYHGIDNNIKELDRTIKYNTERAAQLQDDLAETRQEWEQARQELDTDLTKITRLEEQLKHLEPRLEQARAEELTAAEQLAQAESAQRRSQEEWEEFSNRAQQSRQTAEVEQTRIKQLESSTALGSKRQHRLQAEQQELADVPADSGADSLPAEIGELENQLEALKQSAVQQSAALDGYRQDLEQCQQQLDQVSGELQQAQGRQASLEALQQAALGQDNPQLNQWLSDNGFDKLSRLAKGLRIEPGWELAVESVLGDSLQAICMEGMDRLAELLPGLPRGKVVFVDIAATPASPRSTTALPDLHSKAGSDGNLAGLLAGIHAADNLQQALAHRSSLVGAQSIVTREGVWLGADWIQATNISEQDSIIERRGLIAEAGKQIKSLQQQADALQQRRDSLLELLSATEKTRDEGQQAFADQSRLLTELKSRHSAQLGKIEAGENRQQRIIHELDELTRQLAAEQHDTTAARARLQQARVSMEQDADDRQQLQAARDQVQQELERCQDKFRQDKDLRHGLQLEQQLLQSQLQSTRNIRDRMTTQVENAQQRMRSLNAQLEEADAPLETMERERQQLLQTSLEVKNQLGLAKARVDDNEQDIHELEQSRIAKQRQLKDIEQSIVQIKLDATTATTRQESVRQQLQEAGFELEQVIDDLPDRLTVAECEQLLETVDKRIQRLGSINLAAISDYRQCSERKVYLDRQNEDLEKALNTLQQAIGKINRETRVRFKETFDKINGGLQSLFPRLFGGGRAYLEMTGEDLLDTGIAIMAHPPGKRNSTIHLLSGGEKAMTAIALVFAIFHLNPSPFCMLDEVDAPLDDANTRHYMKLLQEMSANLQIILITHNKITMEMSNKLLGVTMGEPGVSRIVTVDIDEAEALADTEETVAQFH